MRKFKLIYLMTSMLAVLALEGCDKKDNGPEPEVLSPTNARGVSINFDNDGSNDNRDINLWINDYCITYLNDFTDEVDLRYISNWGISYYPLNNMNIVYQLESTRLGWDVNENSDLKGWDWLQYEIDYIKRNIGKYKYIADTNSSYGLVLFNRISSVNYN